MAIFKVVTSPEGKSIGHATPQKLEDYLKFEENERGEKVPRTQAITAINADANSFSLDCRFVAAHFGACNKYDNLKYKHYIQGFPPEDCGKMTEEECHALGVEAAKTFWGDFPVLVVTHYDQEVEGTGEFHWHNHFMVYNCAVTDGHKINTKGSELWAQKRFIAAQAEAHGLTRKGLILENGRIRESQQEVKTTLAERYARKRGQAQNDASGGGLFLTQKAELRLAIISARSATTSYEDFCQYLDKNYHIKTKESRGAISFMHPDRRESGRAWIRGKALGEAYTKEAIIDELGKSFNGDRHIKDCSKAERLEYYGELYREIFGYNPPEENGAGVLGELVDAGELRTGTTDDVVGRGSNVGTNEAYGGDASADLGADETALADEGSSRENNSAPGEASAGANGENKNGLEGGIRKGGTRI